MRAVLTGAILTALLIVVSVIGLVELVGELIEPIWEAIGG